MMWTLAPRERLPFGQRIDEALDGLWLGLRPHTQTGEPDERGARERGARDRGHASPAGGCIATATGLHGARRVELPVEGQPGVADVGDTLARVLLETEIERAPHRRREPGRQRSHIGVALEHMCERGGNILSAESEPPRQHFVEHAREGPDVGALINRFATRLLRAHVRGRAEHDAGLGHGRRRQRCRVRPADRSQRSSALAMPKSSTLTVPSGRSLMLAGFRSRCTMPSCMRGLECIRNLHRNVQRLIDWDRPLHELGERVGLRRAP